jgi:Raf kinase inhibitor-like YbhB/YbcL family protein
MQLCELIAPATHTANLPALILRFFLLLALLLAAPFFAGCRHNDPTPERAAAAATQATAPLVLSSSSLQNSQYPRQFTCDGEDSSPSLAWTAAPPATKSLVLTVTDPDASTFTHWVLYNLPASASSLPANVPKQDQLPDGSRQGRNDFGKIGYAGPCGPHGSTHRYFFDLFALNSTLDLPAGATRTQIEDAMNTHVLARGKLMARYSR